jgi:hypothetical protein
MTTTTVAVTTMKSAQIPGPGADYQIVEREIPQPGPGQVRWASGTAADIEDTLAFAELTGVRPLIETYPLEEAADANARMLSGKAEFRVVLTMSH